MIVRKVQFIELLMLQLLFNVTERNKPRYGSNRAWTCPDQERNGLCGEKLVGGAFESCH